jgi:hypothetical protein
MSICCRPSTKDAPSTFLRRVHESKNGASDATFYIRVIMNTNVILTYMCGLLGVV